MKKCYLLIIVSILISSLQMNGQTIWSGPDVTFTKVANADWTLPANQDVITPKVTFTRQSSKQLYNYQWWQDNFGEDATGSDLNADFWDGIGDHTFTNVGGIQGVRWALLDNTGATTDWSGFSLYGTLGDPTHFYSFNNIAQIISKMEWGYGIPTYVTDDFNIDGGYGTNMPYLVGKKLGVWLVEEDIYLTLTFTDWGSGSGGSVAYTRSTSTPTSVLNVTSIQPIITASKDNISVSGENINSVSLFDLTGNLIMKNSIKFSGLKTFEAPTSNLYIVKVISVTGVTSKIISTK